MSLTSYRAAPPRGGGWFWCAEGLVFGYSPLGGPGGDLLSRALRRSTIGAEGFHGRVRDGIGWFTLAMTTGPPKRGIDKIVCRCWFKAYLCWVCRYAGAGLQADRAISTGKLRTLLRFHTRPIDVVVFHGSQGRPGFEVGFPLRCLQRLSLPYIATLLCRWRDNRSTRGTSTPVLSY